MSRQRLTTDERRAQLLELGLQLFATRAYDDISIDDIAQLAGVSKGLLYHYFGGKKDFYKATLTLGAEHMLVALEPSTVGTPLDRARHGLLAYLDFVESRRSAYLAVMRGGVGTDRDIMEIIESVRQQICASILQSIDMQQQGAVIRLAVRGWVGSVEAASLHQLEHDDVSRDVFVQMMISTLFFTVAQAAMLDPSAGVVVDPSTVAQLVSKLD
ncbi:MAG: AcrR family transcriptional regulator [Kiritimatiellia bacterium]|jgi:AcrR family transcriptional regulator